jgi:hypothetical protein
MKCVVYGGIATGLQRAYPRLQSCAIGGKRDHLLNLVVKSEERRAVLRAQRAKESARGLLCLAHLIVGAHTAAHIHCQDQRQRYATRSAKLQPNESLGLALLEHLEVSGLDIGHRLAVRPYQAEVYGHFGPAAPIHVIDGQATLGLRKSYAGEKARGSEQKAEGRKQP